MGKTTIKWIDKLQFIGTDSTKHSVVMSGQDQENAIGMKPSDLLLVGLGGCTAYDVVDILRKKRQTLTGLEITVEGQQDENPPRAFRTIHIHYQVQGKDLSEKAVADAITLSEEKYCSAAATLRGTAEITFDYTIEEV